MKLIFKNYCWAVILLLLAFFISIAALSIISAAMILLLLSKQFDKKIIWQFITASLLIVLPVAVSGLWSSDVNEWWQLFINKLLLITIGVGLLSLQLTFQQLKIIIWLLTVLVLLASGWSIGQYIINKESVEKSYLVAKVIPVWLDDDHIRFSWLIVLTMMLMTWQLCIQSTIKEKIIGNTTVMLQFTFLHFMAARTGLLCLYIAMLIAFVYFLYNQSTRKYALFFFVGIVAVMAVCFYSLPTLKNRIQYVVWDVKQFTNNHYLQGSADGGRWLSLKAGYDVGLAKPFSGVGFGDIRNEAVKWYDIHYPETLKDERFIPHSEWLVYFAGSGLIGMIVFTIGLWLLYTFFFRYNIFSFIIAVILLIPLITDDSLEGQYGITIFTLASILTIKLVEYSKFTKLQHQN